MIKDITKDTFSDEIEKSKGWVLVDFWGPSCQPCLAIMPHVEILSEEYVDKLKVVKVDSSNNRRLCINLKVMNLPTFILYKDGNEIDRLSGKEISHEDLSGFLEKNVV